MDPINITAFAGASLAPNPKRLNPAVGVNVVDAEPTQGNLKPLKNRLTVATVPAVTPKKTIFRMNPAGTVSDALYWLAWNTVVNVMRLPSDPGIEAIAYTGDGVPKWTDSSIALGSPPYPQTARLFGVPAPLTAPITIQTTPGTGADGTRYYFRTFVNDRGWESAPSAPSIGLVCKPGAIIAISGLGSPPSGSYGIDRQRLYRTNPGTTSGTATFQFLAELGIATATFNDTGQQLGEPIASIGHLPLDDDAYGLIGLWNGMAAAVVDDQVLFCEPDLFYAWPESYSRKIRDKIIALAAWETNLLVLTTGKSVLFSGTDPLGMTETPGFMGFPCSSASGVVSFNYGVVWPSYEGLAFSGQTELLTLGIFTPDQWKALRPETMIAGQWQRFYLCSYDDGGGGGRKGFMFDPLRPGDGVWFLSTGWDACYYDKFADQLYVLEVGNVRKFAGATTLLTPIFKSKIYQQSRPRNFSIAKVLADSYPVILRVWSEHVNVVTKVKTIVLRKTKTVPDDRPFTLPAGFLSNEWQVEVEGGAHAVHLGTRVQDFLSG